MLTGGVLWLLATGPESQAGTRFSERELTFTFAICYRRSVCLFVVCLSVCNVGALYSAG